MSGKFTIAKEKIIEDLDGILAELFDAKPKDRKGSSWFVVNPFRPGAKASQIGRASCRERGYRPGVAE